MAVAEVGIPVYLLLLGCAGTLAASFGLAAFSGWMRLADGYAGEPVRPRERVRFGSVEMRRQGASEPMIYLAHVTVSDDGIGLSLPTLVTFGARPVVLPWSSLADCAYEPGTFASFLFNVPDRGVQVRLTGRAARLVAVEWKRRGRSIGGSPPLALPRP